MPTDWCRFREAAVLSLIKEMLIVRCRTTNKRQHINKTSDTEGFRMLTDFDFQFKTMRAKWSAATCGCWRTISCKHNLSAISATAASFRSSIIRRRRCLVLRLRLFDQKEDLGWIELCCSAGLHLLYSAFRNTPSKSNASIWGGSTASKSSATSRRKVGVVANPSSDLRSNNDWASLIPDAEGVICLKLTTASGQAILEGFSVLQDIWDKHLGSVQTAGNVSSNNFKTC